MRTAQSTPGTRSHPMRSMRTGRGGSDAISLLKQDHNEVKALFDRFEQLEDPTEQEELAQRICKMLTVHTTLEEEHLYPAAQEAFVDDEDGKALVQEAEVEHGSAKALIASIESMDPQDEKFAATVTVLGEYVKHHIKEEEGELFPKLKRTSVDLDEMGHEIAQGKQELSANLGLEREQSSVSSAAEREEEDEDAQEAEHTGSRSGGTRSSTRSSRKSAKSTSGKSGQKRNGASGSRRKAKRR